MDNECLFCKIINKAVPAKIVFENDSILALHDINPKAKIHILIIPKKHIASIAELSDQDKELAGELILTARDIAKSFNLAGGYRVTANTGEDAGQIVHHLHFHLLGGSKLE